MDIILPKLREDSSINEILEDNKKIEIDLIEVTVLQNTLQKTDNQKAPWLDTINSKLSKYGGTFLEFRMLRLLSRCWLEYAIPEAWKITKMISIFKPDVWWVTDYAIRKERNIQERKKEMIGRSYYWIISLLNGAYKIYRKIMKGFVIISQILFY